MTIGELARRAGVGVETVRFYERLELLPRPPRPARGFRLYPDESVERVRFVRQARELGFTLAEAKELLALRARADVRCTAVRGKAERKLAEIDRRIAELTRIRAALDALVETCSGEVAVRDCAILDALRDHRSVPRLHRRVRARGSPRASRQPARRGGEALLRRGVPRLRGGVREARRRGMPAVRRGMPRVRSVVLRRRVSCVANGGAPWGETGPLQVCSFREAGRTTSEQTDARATRRDVERYVRRLLEARDGDTSEHGASASSPRRLRR